jgi:hypothetical protein
MQAKNGTVIHMTIAALSSLLATKEQPNEAHFS